MFEKNSIGEFILKLVTKIVLSIPFFQDKNVSGFVDAGLGFTIDAKVNVNGSLQYKVHNSKGKIYYITANEAYVYVK